MLVDRRRRGPEADLLEDRLRTGEGHSKPVHRAVHLRSVRRGHSQAACSVAALDDRGCRRDAIGGLASFGESRSLLPCEPAWRHSRSTGPARSSPISARCRALLVAAALREETRGAHSRLEFPEPRPVWKRRLVHGLR